VSQSARRDGEAPDAAAQQIILQARRRRLLFDMTASGAAGNSATLDT